MACRLQDYSGADLRLVCKEAAMRPVRRLMGKLDALQRQQGGQWDPRSRAVSDADVQVRLPHHATAAAACGEGGGRELTCACLTCWAGGDSGRPDQR